MTSDDLGARQQLAAERILEDEGLTSELPDGPARALITWARTQAEALAGDATRSDAQVDAAVTALRRAVRAAVATGQQDEAQLVAQATAAFAAATPAEPTSQAVAIPSAETAPEPELPRATAAPEPGGSVFGGLRRMLQRIGWHRRSHRRRGHTRRW